MDAEVLPELPQQLLADGLMLRDVWRRDRVSHCGREMLCYGIEPSPQLWSPLSRAGVSACGRGGQGVRVPAEPASSLLRGPFRLFLQEDLAQQGGMPLGFFGPL